MICQIVLTRSGANVPFSSSQPVHGEIPAAGSQAGRAAADLLLGIAPNESGYLKPYEVNITKKGRGETGVTRWKLDPLPHSHETWLYCGYGPLQLFKPIPS